MIVNKIDQDEYGEVINGEATYDVLAATLESFGSAVIGWTDEAGTHLDILLCVQPIQLGKLQGGMSGLTDLFVAVRGQGMFGFKIDSKKLSPAYVGEKLGLGDYENDTTSGLAELITKVRSGL